MGMWGKRWSWWRTLPCYRHRVFLVVKVAEQYPTNTVEVVELTTAKGATIAGIVESRASTQVNTAPVAEVVDIADDGKNVAITFLPILERSMLIGVQLPAEVHQHQHTKEVLCAEWVDRELSLASPMP